VPAQVEAGGTVAQRLILGFAAQLFGGELLGLDLQQCLRQLLFALVSRGVFDPHRKQMRRRRAIGARHDDASDAELALDAAAFEPVLAQRGGGLGQRGLFGTAKRRRRPGREQLGVGAADEFMGRAVEQFGHAPVDMQVAPLRGVFHGQQHVGTVEQFEQHPAERGRVGTHCGRKLTRQIGAFQRCGCGRLDHELHIFGGNTAPTAPLF
jgi:hypothetical protein